MLRLKYLVAGLRVLLPNFIHFLHDFLALLLLLLERLFVTHQVHLHLLLRGLISWRLEQLLLLLDRLLHLGQLCY